MSHGLKKFIKSLLNITNEDKYNYPLLFILKIDWTIYY